MQLHVRVAVYQSLAAPGIDFNSPNRCWPCFSDTGGEFLHSLANPRGFLGVPCFEYSYVRHHLPEFGCRNRNPAPVTRQHGQDAAGSKSTDPRRSFRRWHEALDFMVPRRGSRSSFSR